VGKRHRRIRARSATGQVAGAATEKPGLEAHRPKRPAQPAFSRTPLSQSAQATSATGCHEALKHQFHAPNRSSARPPPARYSIVCDCERVREAAGAAHGAERPQREQGPGVVPARVFEADTPGAGLRWRAPQKTRNRRGLHRPGELPHGARRVPKLSRNLANCEQRPALPRAHRQHELPANKPHSGGTRPGSHPGRRALEPLLTPYRRMKILPRRLSRHH
jgi:hypothetical protein